MAVERVRQMSVEEYFTFVESSEELYEYIDGELVSYDRWNSQSFRDHHKHYQAIVDARSQVPTAK